MEQPPKVEVVEQDPISELNQTIDNIKNEDVSSPQVSENHTQQTESLETVSADVLVDPLQIEHAVTEIITEIVPVVVENDSMVEDCSSKECDTNNETSFIVSGQLLEVVCGEQSDSHNIETQVMETSDVVDNISNEEGFALEEVKIADTSNSENQSDAVEVVHHNDPSEELVHYVEDSVLVDDTCDAGAMNVVEEIVNTSKSYSVEIQEQDSTDGRENFITKNLVMLEVVSETEETVDVVEESIEEIEMDQTQDCNSSGEKLLDKVSRSEADGEEKSESYEEVKQGDVLLEDANEEEKNNEMVVEATEVGEEAVKTVDDKVVETKVAKATKNPRSVIQEIVDDWIDDNLDDICDSKSNAAADTHDSVEFELKTLLADDNQIIKDVKLFEEVNKSPNRSSNRGKAGVNLRKSRNLLEFSAKERVNGLGNKSKASKSMATNDEKLPVRETRSIPKQKSPPPVRKSTANPIKTPVIYKQKSHLPVSGVKTTTRNLMSQIASTAEVTEVLKERIKEKQKDIDLPQGGDLLFVKKITQRLSSKLSAAANSKRKLSNVLSENYSNNSSDETKIDEADKIETADNTELLAILEGDVDPDWSNLKPQAIPEVSKINKKLESPVESNVSTKFNPLTERELALKQLLELPSISAKNKTGRKKKTFKPAPSKTTSVSDRKSIELESTKTTAAAAQISAIEDDDSQLEARVVKNEEEMDVVQEETAHMEESRSGRKRKPTEKAREHEQNITKKQKVYKGKATEYKKGTKIEAAVDESIDEQQPELDDESKDSDTMTLDRKLPRRRFGCKMVPTKNRIYQIKSTKIVGGNKLPQNIGKRNITVKKLVRQRCTGIVTNAKTVHMKSKFSSSQKKKYKNAMKQKVQKRLLDVCQSNAKPKKKTNEIDKLLQDEGVVNLLYDVEQPEKKRLIPITKSQTKVMDLHKEQRELKIRTKLVRNAVLGRRTSGGSPTKILSRSKRTSNISSPENESRENQRNKSTRSSISSTTDLIFPAKIRNAADASVIVRRHSSSSFSSTSGSPRASIDGPERQIDPTRSDEGPAHVTRSARRRYSQNEKYKHFTEASSVPKKNGVNRKKSTESADNDSVASNDKGDTPIRSNSRTDSKNVEKTIKNLESNDDVKSGGNASGSKITTRSNVPPGEKKKYKRKKGTHSCGAGLKSWYMNRSEIKHAEKNKLSACLAEAASALSNVEGTANQSGSTTANRKLRASSDVPKTAENTIPDVLDQLSNKEINVQRHGNIVQLILTPTSTKLNNGITLQLMHEIREALTLLRRDSACRIVLLTTTGTSFCEGLDLSNLIHENKEERRLHAEEMANGVKEFMKTLANFNKPLVAGIQGAAVGIGVTMLPLFDLIIASDKATFTTPYGQLGQIPEGAAILTLSQTIGNTTTSELLLGGRTLTASEALRAGLVTRVLWPDRFQSELIPFLRAMSEHSSQSMEATKTLLRHNLRKKLDAALESESYLLIQHWCSNECQTLIKNYLDGKGH